MTRSLRLTLLPGELAVCRLDPRDALPEWASGGAVRSLTWTADELSVVCAAQHVPDGVRAERGWRCLRVEGPFAFSEVGVLASIANPLAMASISLFALSTFDTDYVMIRATILHDAVRVLTLAGHAVNIDAR